MSLTILLTVDAWRAYTVDCGMRSAMQIANIQNTINISVEKRRKSSQKFPRNLAFLPKAATKFDTFHAK